MRWVHRAAVLGLGIATLVQIAFGADYVRMWASRAWRNRTVDAMHRSASFLLGARASRYMDWLAASVPAGGSVVLAEGEGMFGQQSVLQFFLMPRTVPSCSCSSGSAQPSLACAQCLLKPNHYVPAIGEFPPQGILEDGGQYLTYPEDTGWLHGLWLGEYGAEGLGLLGAGDSSPLVVAVGIDLAIYCALVILGGVVWVMLACPQRRYRGMLLGVPLAGGLLTLAVFCLARVGLRVTAALYLAAWMALAVGALAAYRWQRRGRVADHDAATRDSHAGEDGWGRRLSLVCWIALGLLLVLAAVLSVVRAYSIFDPIVNWALKGYAIAYEGSILAGARWGGHALAYPQNLHLLIAMFRVAEGDVLPGSKLLDPIFALALGVGLYDFWRWYGVRRPVATLAVVVLISTPIIYQHITYGYANFMYATYLVLGVTQLVWATHEADRRRAVLAGLLVGFAAWTRPEGGLTGLGLLLVMAAYSLAVKKQKGPLIAAFLPFAWIWGTWLSFGGKYQATDEVGTVLKQLIAQVLSEPPKWDILRVFLDYLTSRPLDPRTWGVVFPAGALLLLTALVVRVGTRSKPQDSKGSAIALATIATLIFCSGVVGLGFYQYESTAMLQDTFDRAFFPAAITYWTWAVAAFGGSARLRLAPDPE